MTPEFIVNVLAMCVTGGAVYGAIKSDLRHMHERLRNLERRVYRQRSSDTDSADL